METKGPWERVGFRNRPHREVWEGWMETKGPWERVGFRDMPQRAVREGWMETNPSMRAAVSVIWPGKIDECKEYDNSLHSERNLREFGENIGCDCKENGNSLQSRIKGDRRM